MLNDLGISVKVKTPAELKQVAAELPNFNRVLDRLTGAMEASNVTAQTVVVLGVFGAIVAALIISRKQGRKA
jgi:hypothetical protein